MAPGGAEWNNALVREGAGGGRHVGRRWLVRCCTCALAVMATVPSAPASAAPAAVTPPDPFTSWTDFLEQQELDLLGTPAPAGDRAAAQAALESGDTSPGRYVADVRTSPDHLAAVDPTVRLYRAFFLRIPDRTGLAFWIAARRRGGWTLDRMAGSFASSTEFTNRYGSLSNRDYVLLIYANVLERNPDRGGVDYWTRQLDLRRRTRGSVMAGFSESDEYRAKQASEVTASVLPILLLDRSPTAGAFSAMVARLDGGAPVADEAAAILGSPEYAARAARQRTVMFGDSIPDSLIANGAPEIDLSRTVLVNGTVPACDGVDHPPQARTRDGTIHFMTPECAQGWKAHYPPDLAFRADRVLLAGGANAMLDHRLDGVWRHPCHGAAREWYRKDLTARLAYLHTRSSRVVLVLPPWPGENSGWIMPVDGVARADCVRAVMNQTAKATGTPVIDLGTRLCPNPKACSRPYRTKDGIHVDPPKAPEILSWLLAAAAPQSPDAAAAGAAPAASGVAGLPGDTGPSAPVPLDPEAGTPPPEYRFAPEGA